uniref:Uncharacterized protein n=1 Tax=Rhizophora mucronata TaxID=61149 RepID=A0A2P2ND82_RHIMU
MPSKPSSKPLARAPSRP